MGIKTFIQNELLARLRQPNVEVLVVYDPDQRYRALCLELADATRRVIDASESSIESRAEALVTFQQLAQAGSPFKSMIVYVPAKAPLNEEDKQQDPFALYGACGAVFPASDGDDYFNLCLKAKADYATEIRRIFEDNPSPDFAVIDAVGAGGGWPQLQALLHVESARDLLFALLAPSDKQQSALRAETTWIAEAKALFTATLNLRLMTRMESWDAIAEELWRFLLFSEFVFDLPSELPQALANVPCAPATAQALVEHLCDQLRSDQRIQTDYIERAEVIEEEMHLPTHCQTLMDFGQRDTFPFEERVGFTQAIDALKRDNLDRLRQILERHNRSVWVSKGENQAEWLLLQSVKNLVEACDTAEQQLPDHIRSQDALIDFYIASLRKTDQYQREMEQTVGDLVDFSAPLVEIVHLARVKYRRLAAKVQDVFIKHIEKSGWPPTGRLANGDVFDQCIASRLRESGRRVAVLLIDALRYELGVELQHELAAEGQISLQPAFAQLPSITPVGMASLLPGAGSALRLRRHNDRLVPYLGDQVL